MSESDEELGKKVKARGYCKTSITKAALFVDKSLQAYSVEFLENKRQKLTDTFNEYEQLSKEIMYLDEDDKEDHAAMEENYLIALSVIDQELNSRKMLSVAPAPPDSHLTATASNNNRKLPPITIQTFDGKFTEYMPFINLFSSMIHNDKSLDSVQRLYYLRSFLKDEPLDLIKNLPITAESYTEALKILNDRYSNKYRITAEYVGQILDLKPINKSTAENLRNFLALVKQTLAAIKNNEPNVEYWDPILLCILSRKLDTFTARAYQLERDHNMKPLLEDFLKFIEKRALAMENTEQGQRAHHPSQWSGSKVAAHAVSAPACSYCKCTDHKLFKCKKFQSQTADERLKFIKERKMCVICLGGHSGKCKYHFRCGECKEKHNTLLHCNPDPSNQPPPVALTGNADNNVLLPTVRVKIVGSDGTEYHIKALLDSGSQVSFVTSKVVKLLGKMPKQSSINVIGIGNSKSSVNACIPLEVHSLTSAFKTTISCHIVDQITCNLPQSKFDITQVKIPTSFTLADEQFNVPGEINMLIGSDIFFQALLPSESTQLDLRPPAEGHQLSSLQSGQPPLHKLYVINTVFGCIIGGNLPSHIIKPTCNKVVLKCELNINDTMAQFWANEKVPEILNEKTSEQELCEQIFQRTVKLDNNKFTVDLPLKLPLSEVNYALGESFHFAMKRFLNLEKKLHANPDLFMLYKNFIHEYLTLNHGHYVDIELYEFNKEPTYYLAHFPVTNINSKTTKLRSVFDGSMLTNKKISLNDLQLNGPVLQRELFDIIMLFRLGKHTFTADIRRMFRNILVNPAFTSLQNILWRDSVDDPVKCIRLDTVTYGLKSSSYLATRCLHELANKFENSHPLASSIIKNNTYVDDIIYSNDNLDTTIQARDQLCELLKLGSFQTHKWASNCQEVLVNIPPELQHFDSLDLQKDNFNMKTLGLQINIKDDNFIISSPTPHETDRLTKRSILSDISRIYDPMGYISPIVVTAKAIMQKLWSTNTRWDDSPPANVKAEWLQFLSDLKFMQPILLPRNIDISDSQTAELIGFADASSTTAYGCCIYLRLTDGSGTKSDTYLLCSKSRINPVQKKSMTVPKLELNSVLLLSKLVAKTYDVLKLKLDIKNVYLFSDSQIVLAWLKTEVTKLQAYVGNRVNVIRQNTHRWSWLYVNTSENPADLISRGVLPSKLSSNSLWWNGPPFLQDSKHDFNCCVTRLPHDLPEMRKPCSVFSSNSVCENPLDYVFSRLYKLSDINKIIRLLAYILRFLNNINKNKNKIKTAFIGAAELNNSLMLITKYEQNKHFKTEIKLLCDGHNIKSLANIHPFLDGQGIIRVGGRLHHANISFSHKHPALLHKDSFVTALLIRSEHERLLHAGPRLVLSSLNQRFWIVNGLVEVKKITHKCVTCFRQKATVAKQLMGSLPPSRVTATSRAYEKIGVDFAGPIQVKLSRVRRSVIGKGYILVCVCFVTKAVHLELASDLTTETFLACLRRLISRRGLPTEIHCDNASTFKCARNQLVELFSLQSSESHKAQVHEFTSQKGIDFHFIPSYSPTFGGLWEAAVKSTKYHLKRVLKANVLTYEQLTTVLCEIEAVLNSRPLLPLSSEPNNYCYLTPGHFIVGGPLTMYPESDVTGIPQNRLNYWKQCQQIKQNFWKQWHKYYLNILQNRPKWLKDTCNVQLGSLVILKEDNIRPMSWPMARVVKLFPGHDGKVRAVEVKTPNNKTHIRGIHKICILPIEDNNN